MSEIEKMYRTAKVVPSHHYCNDCKYDMSAECPIRCPDDVAVYPSFTAEKQLELIKWLVRKGLLQINYSSHQCYQFNSFRVGGDYKSNLSEALASHCNNLMQDLTEEEKQQVKGILE